MSPMIANSKKIDMKEIQFEKELLREKDKLIQIRKFVEKNYEFVE